MNRGHCSEWTAGSRGHESRRPLHEMRRSGLWGSLGRRDPPGSPGRARPLCRHEGRDASQAHAHEGTGTAHVHTSLGRNTALLSCQRPEFSDQKFLTSWSEGGGRGNKPRKLRKVTSPPPARSRLTLSVPPASQAPGETEPRTPGPRRPESAGEAIRAGRVSSSRAG